MLERWCWSVGAGALVLERWSVGVWKKSNPLNLQTGLRSKAGLSEGKCRTRIKHVFSLCTAFKM